MVMATMDWVGTGMEVVDGMHAGQSRGGLSHVERYRDTSRVRDDTLMIPEHTATQVRSSGKVRAGIGKSSLEGLNTGRH